MKDWWLLTPARRREVEEMMERMGSWEKGEDSNDGDEDPIVLELEWEDGRRLLLNPFYEG